MSTELSQPRRATELGRPLGEDELTDEALTQALSHARAQKTNVLDLLVVEKKFSEEAVANSFCRRMRLSRVNLAAMVPEPEAVKLVPEEMARKHLLVPLKVENRSLVAAMANPADMDGQRDIEFSSGKTLKVLVATRTEVLDALEKIFRTGEILKDFLENINDVHNFELVEEKVEEVGDLKDSLGGAELPPVVKMVNLVVYDAIRNRGSDIHLEPTVNDLQVRVRIDGVMREFMQLPKWVCQPVVSRIKVLSKMDIAERRVPQDGRLKVVFEGRTVDMRVSTLPTHLGEKVVMRILGSGQVPAIAELGFEPEDLDAIMNTTQNPQGMLLVTGPTGSGKTTSLYALLNARKSPEVNIITVEDPVEYQLAGINQVQINPKAGLTFAGCLRSCLRQDPDIILVGKIRDQETAEVAFHASSTGHLVLSTLHTNSAPATLSRLLDLGVDPFVVGSTVLLVMAQRLARKVCPHCKVNYTPTELALKRLNLPADGVYYRGAGCPQCSFSGFSGRTGIYELLVINPAVREAINRKAPESEIRKVAIRSGGYSSLLAKALAKVYAGLTTPEELLRILQVEEEEVAACPNCRAQIDPDFSVCPYCSQALKALCRECRQHLRPKWSICPYCSTPVGQPQAAAGGPMPSWEGSPSPVRPAPQAPTAPPPAVPEATASPPQAPASSPEAPASPPGSPGAAVAPPRPTEAPKQVKILVVDDDPSIQIVLRKSLEQLPYPSEIFTASDGREALEQVEEVRPDLILLDVMMPGVDGFTVCQKLRENVRTTFIPIIMLTANPDEENRTKGFLVGTDDYMNKPFSVPELLARVGRLLRRTYGL